MRLLYRRRHNHRRRHLLAPQNYCSQSFNNGARFHVNYFSFVQYQLLSSMFYFKLVDKILFHNFTRLLIVMKKDEFVLISFLITGIIVQDWCNIPYCSAL